MKEGNARERKMNVKHWLLPEGVEEILPAEAQSVERLRRDLLDLYFSWGYELVIPPLMEFTDSLLSGVGGDLNLLTLKVTDQLSGQLMGLRADITPQAARIDAHSYVKAGPNRLCYTDHVLHAKPKSPLAIRTPLQAGVELFGEAGLDADIEVISLLLASLEKVAVPTITLDLGHVGICRALLDGLGLSSDQESEYFSLLQKKDVKDIQRWAEKNLELNEAIQWLAQLPTLCGDISVLNTARNLLSSAPDEVAAAIDELEVIHDIISVRYPEINLYFDLGEWRGYRYHTGLVFAAYSEGKGDAIANGGRYDHIGEVFGRARPATGFGINVTSVISLLSLPKASLAIYAPHSTDANQWQVIQALRDSGECVIAGLSQVPDYAELNCNRELVFENNEYKVKELL
ncbi:MAG: ATP phosphoribosyltransferase regulatory subunit [Cellvibrionaceae bacterium]